MTLKPMAFYKFYLPFLLYFLIRLLMTFSSSKDVSKEGVPDLPVAPQDEAGLTKTFQTWPRGWFHIP